MRRFIAIVFVGLLLSSGIGCASMPWNQVGKNSLDNEIGAPPSHFQHMTGRGTGLSDQARQIENRLGYN